MLNVSDNGIGISEEDLPRIFERFYRVDKARSTESIYGTGLGLAIVKHVAQLHGGRVEAESEINKGTTIRVVLPLHPRTQKRLQQLSRLEIKPLEIIQPVGFVDMIGLEMAAQVIATDSGGVQEEAPALSKPVLVLRETTERPEAVEAGVAALVGMDTDAIVKAASTDSCVVSAFVEATLISGPRGSAI